MLSDVEVQRFGLSSFVEALVNIQPAPFTVHHTKSECQGMAVHVRFFIPHLCILLFPVVFPQERSLHYLLPAFQNFEHVLTL